MAHIIAEAQEKWFVWTKKGRAPRFAHDTAASAMAEAERLARLNPGTKFHVLRGVTKIHFESNPPAIEAVAAVAEQVAA